MNKNNKTKKLTTHATQQPINIIHSQFNMEERKSIHSKIRFDCMEQTNYHDPSIHQIVDVTNGVDSSDNPTFFSSFPLTNPLKITNK